MEKKEQQGTTPKPNDEQKLPNDELMTMINRIYDDGLVEELMAPKMRYDLLRLLMPDCPVKTIKNAKGNHSTYNKNQIMYHLVRCVPRLFVAALHFTERDREHRVDDLMEPPKYRKQSLIYKNRFEKLIAFHLRILDEARDEMERLEEGKGYMLESEHHEEIKELKRQHRVEMEDEERRIYKKFEIDKIKIEKEVFHLKHQMQLMDQELKCYKSLNHSNQPCLTQSSEGHDDCGSKNEEEKEEVYLD